MVDNTKFLSDNIVLNDLKDLNIVATRGAGDDVLVSYVGFENSVKNVMRPILKSRIGKFEMNIVEKFRNIDFNDGVYEYLLLGSQSRAVLKADYPDLASSWGITTESFNLPSVNNFLRVLDRAGSDTFATQKIDTTKLPTITATTTATTGITINNGGGHTINIQRGDGVSVQDNDWYQGANTFKKTKALQVIPDHIHTGTATTTATTIINAPSAPETAPKHQYYQIYVVSKILI